MEVIAISPRGFCKGVVRAIDLVRRAVSNPLVPKPIYVFGMIVHNRYVVDELTSLGVISLTASPRSWQQQLSQIAFGTIVVTAHGTSPVVKQAVLAKGLHLIDATCEDVQKTHVLIQSHLEQGYRVLFLGVKGHPEAEGVLAIDPRIELIESLPDILTLEQHDLPVFVANQTTLSFRELEQQHALVKSRFPTAIIQNELCDATRSRQEALLKANVGVDLCYIVGDPKSNNTQSLVRLSRDISMTKTRLIESVADIDPMDLIGVRRVSVSAGASTPTALTEAVIHSLRHFPDPSK